MTKKKSFTKDMTDFFSTNQQQWFFNCFSQHPFILFNKTKKKRDNKF